MTAEVDFNDCTKKGVKALLTKPATHEELSQLTGATVTLRGKFLLPGDASGERGLHLRIEGQREEVDLGVGLGLGLGLELGLGLGHRPRPP